MTSANNALFNEYESINFENSGNLWLEDVRDQDIWLLKVPQGFDIQKLNNKEFLLNHNHTISDDQKDGIQNTMEIAAIERSSAARNESLCLLLPSKNDQKLHICPQEFAGHVTVANIVSIDNTEDNFLPVKKRKVPLPKGLKIRNEPFGMASPIVFSQHLKKKHKKSRDNRDVR